MKSILTKEGLGLALSKVFDSDDLFAGTNPAADRNRLMNDLLAVLGKHFAADVHPEITLQNEWRGVVSPLPGAVFLDEIWGKACGTSVDLPKETEEAWFPGGITPDSPASEEISLEVNFSANMEPYGEDLSEYMSRVPSRFMLEFETIHAILPDLFSDPQIHQGKVSFTGRTVAKDLESLDDLFFMISLFVQEKLCPGGRLLLRGLIDNRVPPDALPFVKSMRLSRTQSV